MSPRCLELNTDLTCSPKALDSSGEGRTDVSAPVGIGCPNRRDDVLLVQRLLNKVPPSQGGPNPKLVEDGIVGPKTSAAISGFQRREFGWADGRVDRGGKTIYKLVAHSETGPTKPTLAPTAVNAIPEAMAQIANARRHLMNARAGLDRKSDGGLFGSSNAAAATLLNRHFHLDRYNAPLAGADEIDMVFSNMQTAIGHVPTGLWIFEDDPIEPPATSYAFTFAGGYSYLRGQSGAFKTGRIYWDRIYLCRRLVNYNHDTIVYAMIHELAHFVGGPDDQPTLIDDHAYAYRDPHYATLPPHRALRNADSYSQYAWEVTRHFVFRPYEQRN